MLCNLKNSLFVTLIGLIPIISGFGQETMPSPGQNQESYSTALTTQEIVDAYHKGLEEGATHMLVVWDTFDFENSYNYIEYCYPNENINELIKCNTAPGYSRVSAVYAMHLDIYEQLNGERWYPDSP